MINQATLIYWIIRVLPSPVAMWLLTTSRLIRLGGLSVNRLFPSDWVIMKWVMIAEVSLLIGFVLFLMGAAL